MSNLKLQQVYHQNYLAEVENIDREYQGGYITEADADEFKAEALLGLQVALESDNKGFEHPAQYLLTLKEGIENGEIELEDEDEEDYGDYSSNKQNMTNFNGQPEGFADELLLGLLSIYGEDNLERGVYDLANTVGVSEANVIDWLQGNDVPDLEETDLIAEAFEVDDEGYIELQALTAYERGENIEDYLYDEDEDDIVEDVVDAVDTVNSKADYALAKIEQAEFNSALVGELQEILGEAQMLVEEGYITPREYAITFSDLANYNAGDQLAIFSSYCNSDGIDEVQGLDRLRHFVEIKKQAGRVLNYTQYSAETPTADFADEDTYYRNYARNFVNELI